MDLIDALHQQSANQTVIELEAIESELTAKSPNYLKRNLAKPPLSNFIKVIPFRSDNHAHKYAKCFSLDYEALSGGQRSADNLVQETPKTAPLPAKSKTHVAIENELANKFGFNKSITSDISLASKEVTNFISLARNTDTTKEVIQLPNTTNNYVKITSSNKRIVNIRDVVVMLACVYLTYAYHRYRLNFYQQNKIKKAKNETVLSVSAIAKSLNRSRTSDTYKKIRDSLAIIRDTNYDFIAQFVDEKTQQVEKRQERKRIFDCSPILSELPESIDDADSVFHQANIYKLKWDDELFNSIVENPSLFKLPSDLITIEPVMVVLYLKLRAMKELRVKRTKKEVVFTTHLAQFLTNYLKLSVPEFQKVMAKANRRQAKVQGFSIEGRIIELFGYRLFVDAETNSIRFEANRDLIFQYTNVDAQKLDAPTFFNEVAATLKTIIELDDEVNERHDKKLDIEVRRYYALIEESHSGDRHIITSFSTKDDLSAMATLLGSKSFGSKDVLRELERVKGELHIAPLTHEHIRLIRRNFIHYYDGIEPPATAHIVMYCEENLEEALHIASCINASLGVGSVHLQHIVEFIEEL